LGREKIKEVFMKGIIVLIVLVCVVMMYGCATSTVATHMGKGIGKSYAAAKEEGVPTGEQILSAWPYISGLIKGLAGDDYKTKIVPASLDVIKELDELASKTITTVEEKGKAVGLAVRLEYLAGKYFKDAFGINLFDLIKSFAG
jgi:predicted ABC-type sugar transport system permease subunit